MLKTKITLFFLIFCHLLFSRTEGSIIDHQTSQGKDFYVLTIPKSGSHLILKMLTMLTGKSHVFPGLIFPQLNAFTFPDEDPNACPSDQVMENVFAYWKSSRQYPLAHFNFSANFHQFSSKHPEYVKIIQIRDLRDICVSCTFQHAEQIEEEIGPCTFDEKLMFLITLGDKPTKHAFLRVEKNARQAVKYIQDPTTITCRFENLVGMEGGGNLEDQLKQIQKIAKGLGVKLDLPKTKWIIENLFGTTKGPQVLSTFREGKIGSWQNYFKEEHKQAFNETLGSLQVALGYPLN